jgi:selenocysteine-specific elongation factor
VTEIRNVIIGTAGHIDHGKSSLVRALTGVDPDRLAEERERGMTIDLGFAPYRHVSGQIVGIIDVPGHERFIKNMVAGSTSVDVVLLVVAADDGVMPQTREHLAIVELLGARRGLVALTKIDLVEPDLVELVREDLCTLLEGSPLGDAAILPVSSTTGEGLSELREALDALVDEVPAQGDEGPFRLPVQRVFSAKGHGTVVTGVPVSGRVVAGDELEIVGHDRRVRVRGVQAYGGTREVGRAGHSTALNITGAGREEVRRGDVVATPGLFVARRRLSVHYRHVAERPLRNREAVRLHVGTAEVLGEAVLLDADMIATGQEGFVQLRLDDRLTAAPGDRFVLRHAAAMIVLGGGAVVAATDGRLKRYKERVLREARERLAAQGDPVRLARTVLSMAGRRGCELARLSLETGVPVSILRERLAPLEASGDLRVLGNRYLDASAAVDVGDDLLELLRAEHARQPLLDWIDLSTVRGRLEVDDEVLDAVATGDDRIERASGGRLRAAGHSARLSGQEEAARERVLSALRDSGAAPPAIDPDLAGLSAAQTRALVEALRAGGEVVAVGPHLFAADVLDRLAGIVQAHGRSRQGAIDIPALRDELGTTRKYLIPLLEYFDARGLTVRHGDRRTLRNVTAP